MNMLLLTAALVAVFAALLMLVLALTGWSAGNGDSGRVRRRLKNVSIDSARPAASADSVSGNAVARNAVEFAGRLTAKGDLDTWLAGKIGSAGLKWSPAEWLAMHVAISLGIALALSLLSGFRISLMVVGLIGGLVAPFVYLSIKGSRRRAKFEAGLSDMLQLVAGSLSAGYSVPQAFDTVARESSGPIAEELDRALLQARVGVPLEDALEGIATRMQSVDFGWVVMAIRVQREIGGNLAEVLTNVAGTLRERDRIRRQIDVLSAEGKLSGWVLGGLPVVFALYLMFTQPEYISLLWSTPMGLLLLSGALVMFGIGVVWMSRIVKVEI